MEESKYVVSTGNAWDGIILHGPFDTFDEANDWCEAQGLEEWHIIPVEPPN